MDDQVTARGENLLLGRGRLFFDRFDADGNPTGLRFLGDCDQFEIVPSAERRDRFNHTKAASSKLESRVISQTHQVNITMGEYTPENLALVLLGDAAAWAQSGDTITGEALTGVNGAVLGRTYQLAERSASSIVLTVGATTLVAGTDYEVVDAEMGLIHLLPTAEDVADEDDVVAAYTSAAYTKTKITAAVQNAIEGKLVFLGDPAGGPVYDAEFWKLSIVPSGAVALITDDYGDIPLQAEALDDSANHASEPYYRLTKR